MNNYYVHDEDIERLKTLKEEYESMGRDCQIDGTRLTVFAGKAPVAPSKKNKRGVDRRPSRSVESEDTERRAPARPRRKE